MTNEHRSVRGVLSEPLDLDGPKLRHAQTYASVRVPFRTRVLHRPTGTYGRVLRVLGNVVVLEDAHGAERGVSALPGAFSIDGETVTILGVAAPSDEPAARITASGSVAAEPTRANVAKAARMWVEGDHDARLIERVWGDDLRDLAIVVEAMHGIDDLASSVKRFAPGPDRRLGVLVDHLIQGSKEQRLVASITSGDVLIVGHPFVDIWECVRPKAVGIERWPQVPLGEEWKTGVCDRLGWGSPRDGWQRVLAAVDSFADLDAHLVGAVEQLLDFLSPPEPANG